MASLSALEGFIGRYAGKAIAPLVHQNSERRMRDWKDKTYPSHRPSAWWTDDPRWYPGGTPPREHNRITPLVDGAEYFPALRDAIKGAQHYVYIIGWFLSPYIPLARESEAEIEQTRLLTLLAEAAQRVPVRILLWNGAPFLIQPTTRDVQRVQRVVNRDGTGDLICHLDSSAPPTHCHHQKAVVVDGQVAFVGGMDLTTYQGDRWDTAGHPLRAGVNWHDVQVRIEGEAVADVEHNFRQRWEASTDDRTLPHRDPEVDSNWNTPAQVLRTIPADVYPSLANGEFGIVHAYTNMLREAQRLIYLENQYLWSPEIIGALKEAMNRPHDDPFRIVVVLPARAYSGKWDNDHHVKELQDADRGRGIVSIYSPYASGPASGIEAFAYRAIYVHAKVAVIDDEWFTVGSANLNERGMISDSEMNVVVHEPKIARHLRLHLWAEHLGIPEKQVEKMDTIELVDRVWPNQAQKNVEIFKHANHSLDGTLHPYLIGKMPGSWLLEEAELLTFEH